MSTINPVEHDADSIAKSFRLDEAATDEDADNQQSPSGAPTPALPRKQERERSSASVEMTGNKETPD